MRCGYLELISGPDVGRPTFPIDAVRLKIGRGPLGKDGMTPNDLQLSESDLTQSRDRAMLRIDPDTLRVYLTRESDTSDTSWSAADSTRMRNATKGRR